MRILRGVLLFLWCGYPIWAHYSVWSGRPAWAVALLGVLVAASLRLAVRGWIAWVAMVLPLGVVLTVVPEEWLLLLPPLVIPLALAIWFAQSLRPGAEPVISRFARLERGQPLDARLTAYTRRLTVVWVVFLAVLAAISAALGVLAPLPVWSAFANGGNYALLAAFFIGEYVFRRIRLSGYRHAPPWELAVIVRRAGFSSRSRER